MTSRERVLAAIRHEQPDRVPIDLGAMRSSGIMAIPYNQVKAQLGFGDQPTRVYDVVQQLAQPSEEILDYVGADVVSLSRAFLTDSADWQDWTLPDGSPAQLPAYVDFRPTDGGWGVYHADGTLIGEMAEGVVYLTQKHWPLADTEEVPDREGLAAGMSKVIWSALPTAPDHLPPSPENDAFIRQTAKAFYDSTDRAVLAGFGGNLLEWGQWLRRMDNFMMDLVLRPTETHALLDGLMESHLAGLDRFFETVGASCDIIGLGDDLGMQQGGQMSPDTYREFFKPRIGKLCEEIRKRSDAAIFLHSCGSIHQYLPDLIEVGIQIINPVQTSAAGMEPERLKREFGKDLVFWGGGCDTQNTLFHGTPDDVRQDVRRRMEIFAPGGGFVFNTIHNILANVPTDNILALWDAAKEFRE